MASAATLQQRAPTNSLSWGSGPKSCSAGSTGGGVTDIRWGRNGHPVATSYELNHIEILDEDRNELAHWRDADFADGRAALTGGAERSAFRARQEPRGQWPIQGQSDKAGSQGNRHR